RSHPRRSPHAAPPPANRAPRHQLLPVPPIPRKRALLRLDQVHARMGKTRELASASEHKKKKTKKTKIRQSARFQPSSRVLRQSQAAACSPGLPALDPAYGPKKRSEGGVQGGWVDLGGCHPGPPA